MPPKEGKTVTRFDSLRHTEEPREDRFQSISVDMPAAMNNVQRRPRQP